MIKLPFVLIHSPLVGVSTWEAVAEYLRKQDYTVFTPELIDSPQNDLPLWQQEVASLKLPETPAVLVGHSGAGALLPAIGQRMTVSGYIFVDAVILSPSATTRLELMYSEDPEFAQGFEQFLRAGGAFPNWRDEHLQAIIPDAELRQKLLEDLRPRALNFFTEHIDLPDYWQKQPCAYLQLSARYTYYADQAEAKNWFVIRRDTHHFEMLTHPVEIAQLLIQIQHQLQSCSG